MKTLVLLLFSISSFAQVTVNPSAITVTADGQYSINAWMSTRWFSGTATTLASAIDNVSTSATLASGTGLAANSLLLVDGGTVNAEIWQVTAKAGAVMTITRAFLPASGCVAGALCTVAIAHASGATVQELKTKGATVQAAYNNFAKQIVMDTMNAMLAATGTPAIQVLQAQQAAITAQIAAAQTAAVQ